MPDLPPDYYEPVTFTVRTDTDTGDRTTEVSHAPPHSQVSKEFLMNVLGSESLVDLILVLPGGVKYRVVRIHERPTPHQSYPYPDEVWDLDKIEE